MNGGVCGGEEREKGGGKRYVSPGGCEGASPRTRRFRVTQTQKHDRRNPGWKIANETASQKGTPASLQGRRMLSVIRSHGQMTESTASDGATDERSHAVPARELETL
ncbi:hypothetical protein EYF80_010740 [Liparis tanakae]|uniref:Uncharacterized protein n=1 Tax=Liparis tanakae TaxID=230148 RepID=A0A4Z2IMP9_9TELE|nr:hypothetical protein EYF80_010740 [Liparis tanakae]